MANVVHDPISFDDLLGVPPEYREQAFMDKYFAKIRPRVTSTDSTDHHDPRAAEASKKALGDKVGDYAALALLD